MKVRRRFVVLVVCALTLGPSFLPTVVAQVSQQPTATKREAREARELAVRFTRRFSQTLDFAIVIDEFFVADAVQRYIAEKKRFAAQTGIRDAAPTSGIFLEFTLLDTATAEDWRRLYAAITTFTALGMLNLMGQKSNIDNVDENDLYPKAVIDLVAGEPLVSNLIVMKETVRDVKTPEEMRHATSVLERANAMARKALPLKNDFETAVLRNMFPRAKQRMNRRELAKARAQFTKPTIHLADSQYYGFPKGTRMMWVRTLAFLDVLLVRQDGKLRVLWAHEIAD